MYKTSGRSECLGSLRVVSVVGISHVTGHSLRQLGKVVLTMLLKKDNLLATEKTLPSQDGCYTAVIQVCFGAIERSLEAYAHDFVSLGARLAFGLLWELIDVLVDRPGGPD